jgi:hypothetical protein
MELRPSAVQKIVDQLNNARFAPGNYDVIMNNCAIFARNLLKNLNKGADLVPVLYWKKKTLTRRTKEAVYLTPTKEVVQEYAEKYKQMLDGKELTYTKMYQIKYGY